MMKCKIVVSLASSELTKLGACKEGLAYARKLLRAISPRGYVKVEWTHLHALWLLSEIGSSYFNFLVGEGVIPPLRSLDWEHCTLQGLTLDGANFERASLRWCFFRDTTMRFVRFHHCYIHNGQFDNAVMLTAVFVGGHLLGCDFRSCRITNGEFDRATLAQCGFVDSMLTKCSWVAAYLDRVDYSRSGIGYSGFLNSTIDECDFHQSTLVSVSYCLARMHGCTFKDANMQDVTFSEAYITNTDFSKAKLVTVTFSDARITNTDFSKAQLVNVPLRDTVFVRCDFSGADLRGVDFTSATLIECKFTNVIRSALDAPIPAPGTSYILR